MLLLYQEHRADVVSKVSMDIHFTKRTGKLLSDILRSRFVLFLAKFLDTICRLFQCASFYRT